MNQHIRLIILAAIVLLAGFLYNLWQEEHVSQAPVNKTEISQQATAHDKDIPSVLVESNNTATTANDTLKEEAHPEISVKTDVLALNIDLVGGDIVHLSLPAYKGGDVPENENFLLFDKGQKRYYIAQSGLTGQTGPDLFGVGRAHYESSETTYVLADDQDRLAVDLKTRTKEGVEIIKRFIFVRGEYTIELQYLINNKSTQNYQGSAYARLKRRAAEDSGSGFFGVQTYTGAAIYTKDTPFKKISFKDIASKPLSIEEEGGWAAMIEHYFLSAWVPADGIKYKYEAKKLEDNMYAIGFVAPAVTVAPGDVAEIEMRLYAGPEITEKLVTVSKGLDLSVDYGILWPICKPIFWLLKKLYDWVGNWGWAIVLITVIIKILFYKLSATSYRSMGNMRKLQPRIEALKERYGDDKQKYSQAVMALYKQEKVNPLGGCLPILVQIPVFIALYYVLLGSVELRQAPFVLWITDLSAKDPYYVLPILMGLSMLLQQKLSPAPPDPVQAKVMMVMPVVFTVLFLNFPAGLVLYWFVNNMLSILQQWFITYRIERMALVPKK